MKYTITAPVKDETTVQVVFFEESAPDLVFKRTVNAVFTEQGLYDEEATHERVAQVADGVANKLQVGAIQLTSLTEDKETTE